MKDEQSSCENGAKMTPKEKAWKACSRYIRLRDALEFCQKCRIDISEFQIENILASCCTCGVIERWPKGDAGHFIGRGLGGRSGVYFDERNINFQCKKCNAFKQGDTLNYEQFMRDKYGQAMIDKLRVKDKIPQDYSSMKMRATEIYFNQRFEELKDGKTG